MYEEIILHTQTYIQLKILCSKYNFKSLHRTSM